MRHLLDYVSFCMRGTGHLDSAGHTLMLLGTVEDVQRHLLSLPSGGRSRVSIDDISHLLRRFELVQQIDNARFWRMADSLPAGATEERLTELWQRSPTTLTLTGAARWSQSFLENGRA